MLLKMWNKYEKSCCFMLIFPKCTKQSTFCTQTPRFFFIISLLFCYSSVRLHIPHVYVIRPFSSATDNAISKDGFSLGSIYSNLQGYIAPKRNTVETLRATTLVSDPKPVSYKATAATFEIYELSFFFVSQLL